MSAPLFDLAGADRPGARLAALAIGVAFGWLLERGGLGRARKLAGTFRLADLTMLKVMLSAIATAALALFWLARLGMLDLDRLYVPPLYLLPQLAGGALFGIGFVLAGLCPGTSCVAAASGRRDGFAVMAGLLAGVLLFGAAWPALASFYERTPRGAVTLPALLGISWGAAVCLLVAVTLLLFAIIERHERRGGARS